MSLRQNRVRAGVTREGRDLRRRRDEMRNSLRAAERGP